MLIVGEKINSTRKSISRAVEERDADIIRKEAVKQVQAGAHTLDVNCGTLPADMEPKMLAWLVETVQSVVDLPLCLDSPNPEALKAGLAVHRGKPIINSISGERARYDEVLPLIKRYNASVVALVMDDEGIPQSKDQALDVGVNLIDNLLRDGVPVEEIYVDPLVRSVATNQDTIVETLALMNAISAKFPSLHFISGLSNVSFGLPERRHINRAFVVLSIANGLDAVIIDPLDETMLALIYAAEILINRDRFCRKYIEAYRQGKLKI